MRKLWVSNDQLREWDGRLTYDEIATANELATGWRPARSTVKKKMATLGLPPRYGSRTDLIPREWHVLPEHNDEPQRFMLQAESRYRGNPDEPLTKTDENWIYQLHAIIDQPRVKLCVGYHQDIGFFYKQRRPGIDLDIIREPC